MMLPVYLYGSPVLRKKAMTIEKEHVGLKELIDNLFDTMYQADGVGLAAPQVGISLRILVIDTNAMAKDDESLAGFKKVFINPKIIEETGKDWLFNEGCLSVPGIREDIVRKDNIRITYHDENFVKHDEYFDGIKGRVLLHEYDHLLGVMFVDRLSQLKKRLLKGKLTNISNGNVDIKYKFIIPSTK